LNFINIFRVRKLVSWLRYPYHRIVWIFPYHAAEYNGPTETSL